MSAVRSPAEANRTPRGHRKIDTIDPEPTNLIADADPVLEVAYAAPYIEASLPVRNNHDVSAFLIIRARSELR
jgi:hypothetical protein